MIAVDGYTLLPCPFCGSKDLYFSQTSQNGKLNRLGKVQKRAALNVNVSCTGCGAEGPVESYVGQELHINEQLIQDHRSAAAVSWNTRDASVTAITNVIQAITEKAIKHINESK